MPTAEAVASSSRSLLQFVLSWNSASCIFHGSAGQRESIGAGREGRKEERIELTRKDYFVRALRHIIHTLNFTLVIELAISRSSLRQLL
jgi:hypothetical protein